MDRANGVGKLSWLNRVIWLGIMSLFLLGGTGCNERLKRMESNQIVLEEKIDQNSRQALLLARKMEMSQGMLELRIDRVQQGNDVALAESRATRYEQEKLREETREFGQKWYAGIMRVEEHQRLLQDSVNGVAGTATVIDEGVQKLDTGQDATRQEIAANHAQTLGGLGQIQLGQSDLKNAAIEAVGDLKRGQDGIKAVASEGVAAAGRVSHQVTDLQRSQDAQTGIIREHHTALIAKVDGVATDQKRFQRSSSQQIQRLSTQVKTGQADLEEANSLQNTMISQRADIIDANLKTTQQNQEDLRVQLKGHHDYALDMGTHVTGIEAEQKRMNDAMQQGNQSVGSAVKAVGQTQKKFQRTLQNVESTTVATHKQAGTIAEKQSEFHALEDQRHDVVIQAMADLESSHNKTQDAVAQVEKTAQGIVQEAGTIRDQQLQADQGLQQEGARIQQGLSQLEKNQGQLQESVDRVQATANAIKDKTDENGKDAGRIREQQVLLQQGMAQESDKIRQGQAQLQARVDRVQVTANTLKDMTITNAEETRGIRDQQAEMQQGIAQGGGRVYKALADVEKNQDQIHRAVNNVQVATNTVASSTTTLMEQQAALQRVTHENQAQLVDSLDHIGANQKAMSQQAETLKKGQDGMNRQIADSQEVVGAKVDAVAGHQNLLQASVEGVAATTQALSQDLQGLQQGQASLKTDVRSGHAGISHEVGQVNTSQASLKEMFRSGKDDLDTQFKSIGKNQAGLQDRLADQRSVSQGLAQQIKLMQQDQSSISQTMDQRQQAWEDQAQDLAKRVAALEGSLGNVDQSVSSLQTNLVSQITELTKVMKALQEQGGAQITQLTADMKDFSRTLEQIRTTQSSLAKRVDQVGSDQAQQSKEFLTALEKLQKQTQNVSATKPVEVEVEVQDVDVVK